MDMPPRFCEICGCIHRPPIHDLARCYPGKGGGRLYFSQIDPNHFPTKAEIAAGVAYWDAVFLDKGTKPLS